MSKVIKKVEPKSKSFLAGLVEKFKPRTNLSGTGTDPTTILSGTVFVQTDINLNSATSFSQYIYNKKILITIIGELHLINFTCDEPSLSIPKYCSDAVNHNAKCKVFLEFNEIEQIEDLNLDKTTIKETFDDLNKSKPLEEDKYSNIIRFDERPKLITREYQEFLYWGEWQDSKYFEKVKYIDIYNVIYTYYINSFDIKLFESKEKDFNNQESYTHLQNYWSSLKRELIIIKTELENNKSKFDSRFESQLKSYLGHIQGQLQYFWSKVCDFYLLEKLFITNDNECNECIVLVGEAHKRNICYLLDTFNKPNKIYERLNDHNAENYHETDYLKKKKCVNIFRTVAFTI